MSEEIYERIKESVIKGYPEEVADLVKKALKKGLDPLEILKKGLIMGVKTVGEKFGRSELFLPDLIMAGNAMSIGSEILRESIEKRTGGRGLESIGKVIICTVKDDIHDIGKNIVITLLRVEGFEVIDLGKDVSTATIVEKVKDLKPDILGLSALLTTTMVRQREVIEALEKAGLRDKVKIMIGGAPTSEKWAEEIGADCWAPDAITAVKKARELIGV